MFHFPSGLFGEGNSKDPIWPGLFLLLGPKQMSDAACEYSSFACPRTCDDSSYSVVGLRHGLDLRWIETLQVNVSVGDWC